MRKAISKVMSVQGNGMYKELYSYQYEFEDGTCLSANHKTQPPPFKEGDMVEYEVRGTKNGFSWGGVRKPPQEGQSSNSTPSKSSGGYNDTEVQYRIEASWAVNTAYVSRDWDMNNGQEMELLKVHAINLLNIRNGVIERLKKYGLPSTEPNEHTPPPKSEGEPMRKSDIPINNDYEAIKDGAFDYEKADKFEF